MSSVQTLQTLMIHASQSGLTAEFHVDKNSRHSTKYNPGPPELPNFVLNETVINNNLLMTQPTTFQMFHERSSLKILPSKPKFS